MAFKLNDCQQLSFDDSFTALTEREKKALEKSWAKIFADEIFLLVRYFLEKCKTTDEVIESLHMIPIASQQTLTVMDRIGNFAVIECNCNYIEVIEPTGNNGFVVATNGFVSQKMTEYNNHAIDNWRSDERYSVAYNALRKNQNHFSAELAGDILSGKHGFMCQYERNKGADTVWSVIYDVKNRKIFRVEGNPSRKKFVEDCRMKFNE